MAFGFGCWLKSLSLRDICLGVSLSGAVINASMAPHKIHWHWVKGHAAQAENERCDQFADHTVATDVKNHCSAD